MNESIWDPVLPISAYYLKRKDSLLTVSLRPREHIVMFQRATLQGQPELDLKLIWNTVCSILQLVSF